MPESILNPTLPGDGAGEQQFLTFALGGDKYGVEILRVQEIKGFVQVTGIPNAPPWFLGVINLRGTVVPVIDLRVRLGLEPRTQDRLTVIVIVSVGARTIGLVVDAVSDVVDLPADAIQAPPAIAGSVDSAMLNGITRRDSELLLLLDVTRVVGASDVEIPAAA